MNNNHGRLSPVNCEILHPAFLDHYTCRCTRRYSFDQGTGGWHTANYTPESIIEKLDAVTSLLPVRKVIIGWNIDEKTYKDVGDYLHEKGIKMLLWLPVFSEIGELFPHDAALDIFKEYGTDSFLGLSVSLKIKPNFVCSLIGVVGGGIVYYIVYNFVILMGLKTDYLKMFSAAIVALFLGIPYLKGRYFTRQKDLHSTPAAPKSKAGGNGNA